MQCSVGVLLVPCSGLQCVYVMTWSGSSSFYCCSATAAAAAAAGFPPARLAPSGGVVQLVQHKPGRAAARHIHVSHRRPQSRCVQLAACQNSRPLVLVLLVIGG
jgi:hypothetical protein